MGRFVHFTAHHLTILSLPPFTVLGIPPSHPGIQALSHALRPESEAACALLALLSSMPQYPTHFPALPPVYQPQASRAANHRMPFLTSVFFQLSNSSSGLQLGIGGQNAHRGGQPTAAAIELPPWLQGTVHGPSNTHIRPAGVGSVT